MKSLLKRFLSYFPTPLPVGMTTWKQFIDDIIELSGQYADRDSMEYVVSTIVTAAPPHASWLSKQYFVRRLRKAAANQIAGQAFQDIRERQKQAAEAAKKAAEDKAAMEAATNDQKPQA